MYLKVNIRYNTKVLDCRSKSQISGFKNYIVGLEWKEEEYSCNRGGERILPIRRPLRAFCYVMQCLFDKVLRGDRLVGVYAADGVGEKTCHRKDGAFLASLGVGDGVGEYHFCKG